MGKFDIKVTGIYQDICLSSEEIATPDSTRDGLVRAKSWPAVRAQAATLWPSSSRVSYKTSKLRVTGLWAGNSPVSGEFPTKGPVMRIFFPFDDVIIDKKNGSLHIRYQFITWTDNNIFSAETVGMKFEKNWINIHFHTPKFIWKCRLLNNGRFSGTTCWSFIIS